LAGLAFTLLFLLFGRPILSALGGSGPVLEQAVLYASVGLTEEQARERYDCAVAVARYEDLLRPVADGQPEGFCKLIVETGRRQIVGAHVLGEYSAEVIQTAAVCMAAGMRVEEVAELQFAFPTFTEAVGLAAKMLVRQLGVRAMPQLWGSLSGPGC
jgi:dihydrolipoamide dehydrogenase